MFSQSLLLAFAIGIAFGWALESAGLGDARKLAGQFYLRDFTVIKVMMSAMVTAMLGLFWLGRLGVVDLAAIYVPETHLAPQIVGGLVFGVGFALCGLCPGTSCVAAASGRLDGAATMGGLFLGVLAAGFAFPLYEDFYNSTPFGSWTIPEGLGAPYGVVVFAVVAGAVFVLSRIDRWFAAR